MDHEKKAEELFLKGYNCAQAVAASFADVLGMPEDVLLKSSCAFGGGFARQRYVCGALSGAGMVLGLLYTDPSPDGKKSNYQLVRGFSDSFKDEFGSIICSELLSGASHDDPPTPSERTNEFYKKRSCLDCVKFAARLLDEKIAEEK
ncbi:MAG: C-GCAxxG-C-C family protein [Clostridiales bacterium]|nr:C-GCAxxG-C-C family protein [Clostridiales bacterium]